MNDPLLSPIVAPNSQTPLATTRHGTATVISLPSAQRTKATRPAATPAPRTTACHQFRASSATCSTPPAATSGSSRYRLSRRSVAFDPFGLCSDVKVPAISVPCRTGR
jgi:hypothetical protein